MQLAAELSVTSRLQPTTLGYARYIRISADAVQPSREIRSRPLASNKSDENANDGCLVTQAAGVELAEDLSCTYTMIQRVFVKVLLGSLDILECLLNCLLLEGQRF